MGIFSKFKKGFQKGASVIQGAFDTISGKGLGNTIGTDEEGMRNSANAGSQGAVVIAVVQVVF